MHDDNFFGLCCLVAYEKVTQKHKVYYVGICVLITAYQYSLRGDRTVIHVSKYKINKPTLEGQGLSSQMSNKLSQIK